MGLPRFSHIQAARLNRWAQRLRRLITSSPTAGINTSHAALLWPLAPIWQPSSSLVVVPDGVDGVLVLVGVAVGGGDVLVGVELGGSGCVKVGVGVSVGVFVGVFVG